MDQQLEILLFSLEYWVPATYSSIRNDYCRLANLAEIALSKSLNVNWRIACVNSRSNLSGYALKLVKVGQVALVIVNVSRCSTQS